MKLPKGYTLVSEQEEQQEIKLPKGYQLIEEPEVKLPKGYQLVEDEEPESAFLGGIGQAVGKLVEPFQTEQQTFSPEIMKKAKEELKKTDTDSEALTAASGVITSIADTVLFGNFAEATAALESLVEGKDYEERKQVREAMMQMRRERAPVGSVIGTIAGFLTPGGAVSAAGKAARAAGLGKKATTAAQAAAATAQSATMEAETAKEGKELEAVAKTVAFDTILGVAGTALGAVGKAALKPGQKAMANQTAKVAKGDAAVAKELADQAAEVRERNLDLLRQNAKKASDLSDDQLKEIVSLRLSAPPRDVDLAEIPTPEQIAETMGLGKRASKQIYNDMVEQARRDSFLEKVSPDVLESYQQYKATADALDSTLGKNFAGRTTTRDALNFFMDAQYVMNYADRKYGTELAPLMNKVSEKSNELSNIIDVPRKRAQDISDNMTLSSREVYDAIENLNALKSDDFASLPKDAQEWVGYFAQLKDVANDLAERQGMGKNFIKNLGGDKYYIPHRTKRPAELEKVLNEKVREIVGKPVKRLVPADAAKLMKDRELVDALSYMNASTVKDPEEILSILRNPMTSKKMASFNNPKTALQRTQEQVPELIREDDLARLAGDWINSTFSNIMMRGELGKMRGQAMALKEVDPGLSRYLNSYVDDQLGVRRGLSGKFKDMADDFRTAMYRKAGETGNPAWMFAGEIPGYLNAGLMNMYPYFLGVRVDALVRNSTQPIQQTATSIGSGFKADGIRAMGPAMFDSYFDLAAKGGKDYRRYKDRLKKKGWLPADPTPQDWEALNRGIRKSSKAGRAVRGAKGKLDKIAMYLYQEGDVLNRIVTLKTADRLTAAIAQGNQLGDRFLKNVPPGYRRKLTREFQSGDLEKVNDTIAEYLLAHTQFNYNRASMSEFGRWAGGIGSMFSKWPTAILGDTIDTVQAARYGQTTGGQAARQLGRKYMMPFMMLYAAQQYYADAVEENPALGQIIGKDLTSYSSATSLTPWVEGTIIQPPVFDILENPEKAISLVPTATYFRFIDERVPRFLGEDEDLFKEQKDAVKETIKEIPEELGLE